MLAAFNEFFHQYLAAQAAGDLTTSPRVFLVIMHIIGAVIGVGAATAGDVLFFKTIRDGRINATELSFMRAVSKLVWIGLILLVVSGLGFLWLYLYVMPGLAGVYSLPKIFAKSLIVAIITINGMMLHLKVMPLFEEYVGRPLTGRRFASHIPLIFSGGAISVVSWYTTLIVGAWRGLSASFTTIISVYVAVLISGIIAANVIGYLFVRSFRSREQPSR